VAVVVTLIVSLNVFLLYQTFLGRVRIRTEIGERRAWNADKAIRCTGRWLEGSLAPTLLDADKTDSRKLAVPPTGYGCLPSVPLLDLREEL
jgi:hypothetical protein